MLKSRPWNVFSSDATEASMTKTLITGANGFIGYHLVKTLCEAGRPVRCLVRPSSDTKWINAFPVEYVHGEMNNRESLAQALDNVSVVFHLAGITQETPRASFQQVNVEGTKNLLEESLRLLPPPLFLFVSSLAAAGPARRNRPKVETDPPKPVSAYGKSKWAAEQILIDHSQKLPCSIVRPPFVFGETDDKTLAIFQAIRRTGLHLIPGWYNRFFSFLHATDLANLLLLVEKQGERLTPNSISTGQGIYFASCYEDIRYAELGKMIGSALHRANIPTVKSPPIAVYIYGIYGEIKKRLGKNTAFDWNKAWESLNGPWICNGEKAQKQLGFQPACSLQERLNQTTKWYQENGLL